MKKVWTKFSAVMLISVLSLSAFNNLNIYATDEASNAVEQTEVVDIAPELDEFFSVDAMLDFGRATELGRSCQNGRYLLVACLTLVSLLARREI